MKLLFDLLTPDMERSGFTCGEPALDAYPHKQAGQDMRRDFATVIAVRLVTSPEKGGGFLYLFVGIHSSHVTSR